MLEAVSAIAWSDFAMVSCISRAIRPRSWAVAATDMASRSDAWARASARPERWIASPSSHKVTSTAGTTST